MTNRDAIRSALLAGARTTEAIVRVCKARGNPDVDHVIAATMLVQLCKSGEVEARGEKWFPTEDIAEILQSPALDPDRFDKPRPPTVLVKNGVGDLPPVKQAKTVLESIRNGATTSIEVSEDTGISPASASAILSSLKKEGAVEIISTGRVPGRSGAATNHYAAKQEDTPERIANDQRVTSRFSKVIDCVVSLPVGQSAEFSIPADEEDKRLYKQGIRSALAMRSSTGRWKWSIKNAGPNRITISKVGPWSTSTRVEETETTITTFERRRVAESVHQEPERPLPNAVREIPPDPPAAPLAIAAPPKPPSLTSAERDLVEAVLAQQAREGEDLGWEEGFELVERLAERVKAERETLPLVDELEGEICWEVAEKGDTIRSCGTLHRILTEKRLLEYRVEELFNRLVGAKDIRADVVLTFLPATDQARLRTKLPGRVPPHVDVAHAK